MHSADDADFMTLTWRNLYSIYNKWLGPSPWAKGYM